MATHGLRLSAIASALRMSGPRDWRLTLTDGVSNDTLLPQSGAPAPAAVLANLPALAVVSATGTALQVDAGVAPPAGGGFEVRRRDWAFGPGTDSDLVLRSPVRSFAIPREGQVERYFVRMYDGSNTAGVLAFFQRCIYGLAGHVLIARC